MIFADLASMRLIPRSPGAPPVVPRPNDVQLRLLRLLDVDPTAARRPPPAAEYKEHIMPSPVHVRRCAEHRASHPTAAGPRVQRRRATPNRAVQRSARLTQQGITTPLPVGRYLPTRLPSRSSSSRAGKWKVLPQKEAPTSHKGG